MADAPKRVAVVSPDGQFGTVDESELDQLPDGARVLSSKELAQRAVDERYEALPTAQKALGVVNTAVGALNPITFGGDPNAPPTIAAYGGGVRQGLTAGLADAGLRKMADAVGGKAAGDKFAEQRDQEVEASPIATGAGNVTGMVGGAALSGAGAGAARALPSAVLGTAGNAIEHGVARALGGLASRGALGRATAAGAGMAVRGATEGAAYAGIEQAASDVVHDTPDTLEKGEKYYAAMGHGALAGGGLGGALGFSGSLISSGVRGIARRVGSQLEAGAAKMESMAPALPEAPVAREVPFIDPGAGLRGGAPAAESPISMGAERRPLMIRGQGKLGAPPAEDAIGIGRTLGIDPDAGLRAPINAGEGPIDLPTFNRASRRGALDAAMRGEESPLGARLGEGAFDFEKSVSFSKKSPLKHGFEVGIDPDAGLAARDGRGKFQGKAPAAEDGLFLSADKRKIARNLDLNVGDEFAPIKTESPIKIPGAEPGAPAAPKGKPSIMSMLSDPSNAARAAAQDQAWDAIGRGFGLQTTNYAKAAQKYFPNGTRDLGEVAIRHGLFDMGAPTASPAEAAWAAAKSGMVSDIAPKAEIALEQVGKKIGDITDASGARVDRDRVLAAIDSVAREYESAAATRPIGRSIRSFGAELVDSLGLQAEGATARVQDVIRERRAIDRLAFQDAPTLDPKTALQAKRELRWHIEDVISSALDDASGQVPGQLRDQYKALKKDYHALSIINEAAADSAARSTKNATLGLGEKFAMASAVASGNFGAAPVLAIGGKAIRERGNAAAAAFLSRAADRGTFNEIVRQFDRRVAKSAAGVLRDAGENSPRLAQRAKAASPTRKPSPETGRAEVNELQTKAKDIVRWVGDMRASPKALMDQLQEASAVVGQTAGPKAAEGYTAATLRAIGFVAGYVPQKERRDPLDPKSVPPLTYEEADRLVRAAKYATKPASIFDDFERGVVTPEGLRAAKAFVPGPFREFQMELQQHVEDHMLRNKQLTDSQRLRVDKLLGYPAGADLKPRAISRLQGNLMKAPEEPPAAGPMDGGAPPPPVNMQVQQTGFDAVEARQAS